MLFATHPDPGEREKTLTELAGGRGGETGVDAWRARLDPHLLGLLEDELNRGQFDETLVLLARLIGRDGETGDCSSRGARPVGCVAVKATSRAPSPISKRLPRWPMPRPRPIVAGAVPEKRRPARPCRRGLSSLPRSCPQRARRRNDQDLYQGIAELMKTSRVVLLGCALLLAACSNVAVVGSGEAVVAERLSVRVEEPWNRFEGGIAGPIPTWTREGITVDALQFFVAVQDGKPIAPARDKEKPMIFRAGMQAHEIVSLFENLYTQDGSTFKLDRWAPGRLPRCRGFPLRVHAAAQERRCAPVGVGWAAVRGGSSPPSCFRTAPAFLPQ